MSLPATKAAVQQVNLTYRGAGNSDGLALLPMIGAHWPRVSPLRARAQTRRYCPGQRLIAC